MLLRARLSLSYMEGERRSSSSIDYDAIQLHDLHRTVSSNVCVLTFVLRMRSSGVAGSLGGLRESNSAMSASMLSMEFSRERTPRPASSSTFFTVFRREDTFATIICECGVSVWGECGV